MRQQANEKNYLAEAYYLHDMRNVFNVSPWRYRMPQDFMYGGVCHPVDLLRWFLGEVDEVFAYEFSDKISLRQDSKMAMRVNRER